MSMNIEINMNVVMRKLLYTSITALLLLGALFSCTDEDYKLYNTSLTNKIYFDKDTFFFEYGPREDKEVDLEVPISLIGLANFDRDVEFKVSADVRNSTAKLGVHYNMDEIQVFMKDSVTAAIKLDFKRDNLVKDIQYKLYLNLEANDEYIPTNRTKCLDNESHSRYPYLLTTYVYLGYFKQHIYTPMYEYYLQTGDEHYKLPNPATTEYE